MPPVDVVAHEQGPVPFGVTVDPSVHALVSEPREQCPGRVQAPVDVSDEVERARFALLSRAGSQSCPSSSELKRPRHPPLGVVHSFAFFHRGNEMILDWWTSRW
jgi:hypothetical protein